MGQIVKRVKHHLTAKTERKTNAEVSKHWSALIQCSQDILIRSRTAYNKR